MQPRPTLRVLVVTLPLALLAFGLLASAATPSARPPASTSAMVTKSGARTDDAGSGAQDVRELWVGHAEAAQPSTSAADGGRPGENGQLVQESEKRDGGASIKVFRFGTTEVEGRTRWPAVTYFVRRLKAEFEPKSLPHRSFLPELEGTKNDPAVR